MILYHLSEIYVMQKRSAFQHALWFLYWSLSEDDTWKIIICKFSVLKYFYAHNVQKLNNIFYAQCLVENFVHSPFAQTIFTSKFYAWKVLEAKYFQTMVTVDEAVFPFISMVLLSRLFDLLSTQRLCVPIAAAVLTHKRILCPSVSQNTHQNYNTKITCLYTLKIL